MTCSPILHTVFVWMQVKALYPRGTYVLTADWPEMFRDLNLNKCDAGLVSETAMNAAFSGVYAEDSCAREDKGEDDWACLRAGDGTAVLTRDCRCSAQFIRLCCVCRCTAERALMQYELGVFVCTYRLPVSLCRLLIAASPSMSTPLPTSCVAFVAFQPIP